jgi:hypothetical protein
MKAVRRFTCGISPIPAPRAKRNFAHDARRPKKRHAPLVRPSGRDGVPARETGYSTLLASANRIRYCKSERGFPSKGYDVRLEEHAFGDRRSGVKRGSNDEEAAYVISFIKTFIDLDRPFALIILSAVVLPRISKKRPQMQ